MGQVYLAEDTRLNRKVALKLLPPSLVADEVRRKRFDRESKALAALNHPNVVTIHAVEEVDGQPFLVMEWVQGRSLEELIPPAGFPIDRLLELAVPIAEALEQTHRAGIIHRDLKPANLMVRDDGVVKLVDFGISKMETQTMADGPGPRETAWHTAAGQVLGTLPYMSPEQLEGWEVDARSDLYSLGIILYRMATGRYPFQGDGSASLISAILRDPPPPLVLVEDGPVPEALKGIVLRCLEKDRNLRFQTAGQLRRALADLRTEASTGTGSGEIRPRPLSGPPGSVPWPSLSETFPAAALTIPPQASSPPTLRPATRRARAWLFALGAILLLGTGTLFLTGKGQWLVSSLTAPASQPADQEDAAIAVLPLRNLSGGAEHDYFSEGTTEALIANLAKVGALRVTSRSAVMRYKESDRPHRDIARELGVRYILEGSVMRQRDQLMIIVQLVDPETDGALWGESYRGSLRDIFNFQTQVAETVARKTKGRLTSTDRDRLARVQEVDPEVYELYLKGRFLFNKKTSDSTLAALSFFEQALAKDPRYALAWAAVAECYVNLSSFGVAAMPPLEAMPKAAQAARHAIELDETLADAHLALADTAMQRWDWTSTRRELQRAIQLSPGSGEAHSRYGRFLTAAGHHREAIQAQMTARKSDPLSLNHNQSLANTYYFAGRYDDALRRVDAILEIQDYWVAHLLKGESFSHLGNHQRAHQEMRKALELDPDNAFILGAQGRNFAVWGKVDEARKVLAQLQERSPRQYVAPSLFAKLHFALGEREAGFQWLERALRERDQSINYLKVDPAYATVRSDPRFQRVLREIGLDRL